MIKKRVAILFGGLSGEHEVSCRSGAAIAENIDASQYEVYRIGITKKGRWLLYPGPIEGMRDGTWADFPDNVPAALSPDRTTRGLLLRHGATMDNVKLDVVFPALHGYGGEDGTVQGLLELSGIPYVGCGVLSSALCMDKASSNRLFDSYGIPHTPWMAATSHALTDFDRLLAEVQRTLSFPLCVKPAGAGSSLGVSKVNSPDELRAAALLACAHDSTILFEQFVQGKEIECAVLGNNHPVASVPGEVESCNEIYDYDAKYRPDSASRLFIPARITQQQQEETRRLALQAYKALGCSGLARVDFFVEDGTGRVLINEINTLPGFTAISLYPKLMEHSGIPFPQLIDRLVELALERAER